MRLPHSRRMPGRRRSSAPEGRPWHIAAVTAGAGLAVTWSLTTHSAAGDEVAPALPADVVHQLSMSVRLGGLPVPARVLLRSGDLIGTHLAVPRFSRTARICTAPSTVTGIYQSRRRVGTPSALFATTHGGLPIEQPAMVVVEAVLGAVIRTSEVDQVVPRTPAGAR